jgi:hypothetical protein
VNQYNHLTVRYIMPTSILTLAVFSVCVPHSYTQTVVAKELCQLRNSAEGTKQATCSLQSDYFTLACGVRKLEERM